jgi:acetyl-CoA acetyltransferase
LIEPKRTSPTAKTPGRLVSRGNGGTRYVLTLATELRLREARYGVLGVCVGSGQGVALVLENPGAA